MRKKRFIFMWLMASSPLMFPDALISHCLFFLPTSGEIFHLHYWNPTILPYSYRYGVQESVPFSMNLRQVL